MRNKTLIRFWSLCITALIVGNMQVAAQKVTFREGTITLKQAFEKIEKASKYKIAYNDSQLDISKKVPMNQANSEVLQVLTDLLKGTGYTYKLNGNYIIITPVASDKNDSVKKGKKITGIITDEKGEPVIGANVLEKGTANGTITNLDGAYSLELKNPSSVLQISYIGYNVQEVAITNKSVLNIQLKEDTQALDEIVVTALGIKRSEKALGYAVQKVKADGLTASKGIDISASLTGKVAGLNIQNSTEFNETPALKLRGEEPLLIIDGVPYGNMSINDVASDDIESIEVLKGATASALYGARGGSGAIMVTTKKGAQKEGTLDVSVNSNTMFFAGYLAFPEVQHSYSAGTGGKYNNNAIWGDKLDIGRTAVMWDPYTHEFHEQELVSKGKDNFQNLLQLSLVTNNNVSVSQKGKYGSFRTSLTHVYNKGQYPNQNLNKVTFNVGGEMTYKNLKMDASISYNKRISSNEAGSGYSNSYIYDMVIWGGTEFDVRDYRNYWIPGREHEQQNWYDRNWYDNPYFKAYEVIDSNDNDIMNAYLNLSYDVTSWLKVIGRAGLDTYSKKNIQRNPMGANYAWDPKGYYGITRKTGTSVNTDAMLMADKTWGKFNLNALAGGNIYYYVDESLASWTQGGLTVPGFYSLNASVDPLKSKGTKKQKRVNSFYGKLSLSWASTYFLDVTGRNDWSSTLSSDARSYFYPSVAGSVILSEIIKLPSFWQFWKVRASWTTTKQDADVYANNNVYTVEPNIWDGLGTAVYPTSLIGGTVRPKSSETFEAGTAMNFFGNRLFADVAYFRKVEKDFIINGGVSDMTGFTSVQLNSKEQRLRQGFELTIGGTPIQTEDFKWDILTNWSRDRYTYLKVDPDYSTKKSWIQEGARWDWLEIYDWDRDPEGNIIHNGGIPVKQTFKTKVGNTAPDLVWGITNTLRYKNWTLSFTIDGRVGGLSFSRTHQMLWNSGSHIDTDNEYRYEEVVNGRNTFVGKGVKVVSGEVKRDADGNILEDSRVFAPNDVVVSYEAYITKYHDAASKPSRQNVLDETFFKLRNLSLTYELPKTWCSKLHMKDASISLTGQNLFLWAKDYKYADPDKGGDEYGYENLNSPSQRYIGFNVKANF
ncbi:SusC/RagA family TonB-linked outer membrane protein [Bacteroides sp.]